MVPQQQLLNQEAAGLEALTEKLRQALMQGECEEGWEAAAQWMVGRQTSGRRRARFLLFLFGSALCLPATN